MRIGIDLGTTYSAAAYIKGARPSIVLNGDGDHTTPSVVLFESDGSITVGNSAKERMVIEPENIVATVKDFMGTDKKFVHQGIEYTPEEVSSFILKKIVQDSEQSLGQRVDGVVVTIPAYFTDAQRKSTEDACEMAGLQLLGMINEPTAAALCYMQDQDLENSQNIMVYDLGGGTFDVSIVTIGKDSSNVVATGGLRKLGGHFFDQKIIEYIAEYMEDEDGIDLFDDEYVDVLQELVNKAEKCKIQLSNAPKADIILRAGAVKKKITITREQFENMIRKFYERTESCIDMALSDAGMEWKDIDKILMVGGSSRIPYIRSRLKAYSGIEPSVDVNPDEAVCFGAAIYANNSDLFKIRDVCSHSLGVAVLDPRAEKINAVLIERNTPIPASAVKQFVVPSDDITTIQLELTEGEGEEIEYVTIFSEVEISINGKAKAGTPVELEFHLDSNQLLNVFVKIKTIPEIYEKLYIDRKSNLTTREVQRRKSALAMTVIQ